MKPNKIRKKDVGFTASTTSHRDVHGREIEYALFFFYTKYVKDPSKMAIWDEEKRTIEESIKAYPPEKYNWIYIGDSQATGF